MEKEAKIKVVIIKNNLKYRIPGFREGKSFVPKIGQIISLPEELVMTEIESGNIRKLFPEEKDALAKKKAKKKAKAK
jgi:hypothetical protein